MPSSEDRSKKLSRRGGQGLWRLLSNEKQIACRSGVGSVLPTVLRDGWRGSWWVRVSSEESNMSSGKTFRECRKSQWQGKRKGLSDSLLLCTLLYTHLTSWFKEWISRRGWILLCKFQVRLCCIRLLISIKIHSLHLGKYVRDVRSCIDSTLVHHVDCTLHKGSNGDLWDDNNRLLLTFHY